MRCDRCNERIEKGEEMEFHSQIFCEECYMEALSPSRGCDPWAVRSATSLSSRVSGDFRVNETQTKILELLRETGGLEQNELAKKSGIRAFVLMRELVVLRHMEKIRCESRDGKNVYVLW